jgi:gliding motility-associated-like protein
MKLIFEKYLLIICLLSTQVNAFCQTLNDSLIAHYPFDGNALDISGNANHGTLFGPQAVADRFGNSNAAYNFNGTSDYIHYFSNTKFKPETFPISLTMWVKSNDNSVIGPVFKNDVVVDSYTGIWLQINSTTGRVEISYGDGGTTSASHRRTKSGVINVNDNQWHFIAVVIRSALDMDIWVDCQYDSGTYSGTGSNVAYSNNVGSSGYFDVVGPTHYYEGVIDDIRFYHRALSQADLQALYVFPQPYFNSAMQNFSLGNDTSLCGIAAVNLNANISFPNISYNWSTGSTQNAITVFTPGTYWLEIGDGCSIKRDTIVIDTNNLTIITTNDTVICSGNPITLSATGNAANYVWTANGVSYPGNPITVNPTLTTIYFVQGFDSSCTSPVETVIVSVQSNFSSADFNAPSVICENVNYEFTNNSTLGVNYLWNFGDPASGVNNTSTDFNGSHTFTQAGTYYITLTVQGPCFIDSTIQVVNIIEAPVTVVSNDLSICEGESALLVASGGSIFAWDNNIGATSDSINVFPTISTMYQVQAIANGCFGSPDSVFVTVNPRPEVSILASDITCSRAPILLIAAGNAANYIWSGGYTASNDSIFFVPQINTDYILTGYNANCSQTDTFQIIAFDEPKALFDIEIDTCAKKLIALNKSSNNSVYLWNFDDQQSNLQHPTFAINNFQQDLPLQLILNPNTLCADTALATIAIKDIFTDNTIVPNVFTPNGDDINDVFKISSRLNCTPLKIQIYNRWGDLIFTHESKTIEWDGKHNNKELTPGIYFYIIEHDEKVYQGSIALFR